MGVRGLNLSEVQKNKAAEGQRPHPHGSVKQQAFNAEIHFGASTRRFLIEAEVLLATNIRADAAGSKQKWRDKSQSCVKEMWSELSVMDR